MKDYNDYVAMTRKYLKDYYQLQIAGKNLAEEIEAQTTMLQSEPVAISRYGGAPGGGGRRMVITKKYGPGIL